MTYARWIVVSGPAPGVAGRDVGLPGEVGEGLVGVGHFVDVFAFGDGGTFAVVGGDQLVGEFDGHWAAFFVACGL